MEMFLSNTTAPFCNGTDVGYMTYEWFNKSESEVYVTECIESGVCMSLSECRGRIKQYIQPKAYEWIVIIIYIVIFLVGLLGNGLVCFVVFRNSNMRTVVNIFIVNLAIADFLVLLICLPPSVVADTTETWWLGGAMCKVVPFLQVRKYELHTS